MKKLSLGFLLLAALCAPSFVNAATQASKDFDDQGLALFNKGLYSKSVEYFQDAVQADSSNWQAYEDLGNAYAQLNQTQNALDAYQNSLGLNPNNQTVRDAVTNLGGNPDAASSPAPVQRNHSRVEVKQAISGPGLAGYGDGLPYMDHAKVWTKAEIGYDYSKLGELVDGANNINNKSYVNADLGLPIDYDGSAVANNGGLDLGAEVGLLLNPNNGISLGMQFITTADYTADVAYADPPYNDSEDATFSSYLVPITLNYYFFLPDSSGRFFLTGGVGYYVGAIHVNETYTYSNFYNQAESSQPQNWVGDLYSGNIGFQVGVGREFALNNHLGLEIFARGRYVKITNYRGTLVDTNSGNSALVGMATGTKNGTVDFDAPANITAANGEKFTTLDYTGFDIGVGLTYF